MPHSGTITNGTVPILLCQCYDLRSHLLMTRSQADVPMPAETGHLKSIRGVVYAGGWQVYELLCAVNAVRP